MFIIAGENPWPAAFNDSPVKAKLKPTGLPTVLRKILFLRLGPSLT